MEPELIPIVFEDEPEQPASSGQPPAKRRWWPWLLVGALAVAAIVAAVVGGSHDKTPPVPVAQSTLAGTSWLLQSFTDKDGAHQATPGSNDSTISGAWLGSGVTFGADVVQGSDGCNHFGTARATVSGNHLDFGTVSTTYVGCLDPVLQRQVAAFTTVLNGGAMWRTTGSVLTLSSGTVTLQLAATPASPPSSPASIAEAATSPASPPVPQPDWAFVVEQPGIHPSLLTSTSWRLTSYAEQDGALSKASPGAAITLVIDGGGGVVASDGCNVIRGEIDVTSSGTVDGVPARQLAFYESGDLGAKSCPSAAAVDRLFLGSADTGDVILATVQDGDLTLKRAGGVILRYATL
ncbi:MAG TPA: META domain-containing protein [Jatrophihabitans sp.]|jgi:heat shock protein HslJ